MLSFKDCLGQTNHIKRHVFLGNGFSIACRPKIFSYNSLYDSADFESHSKNLRPLFETLGTRDFEVVMFSLHQALSTIKVYDPSNYDLIRNLENDYEILRKILIDTLSKHHPVNPSDISDLEYQSCVSFLNNFERIFTLNYDLLLYWVSMKMNPLRNDGFSDPFTGESRDYKEESYVSWSNEKHLQSIYYLHGALHLYMNKTELQKFCWSRTGQRLILQIDSALKLGKFPLVVSESESDQKMARVQRSSYLGHGYRSLSSISGSLFIFGHSLARNDDHFLNQISKNRSLKVIFISIFGDENSESNKEIMARAELLRFQNAKDTRKDILFYSANSAKVWGT